MVEWKNRLNDEVGEKAKHLDRIDNFPVPNFFVVTSREIQESFRDEKSAEQILNKQFSNELEEKLNDAYKDIGMSSEVRNANGKAKSLVGGQRNNQLVSVRVSNSGKEYDYELNVGSSDLVDAFKKVVASYFSEEKEFPTIIVQKMVEPDYSGSAMLNSRGADLLEVVEGLGTSLEEGENTPYIYTRESGKISSSIPSEHVKVSRNPINGGRKEKKVEPEMPFDESEVKEMFGKLESENLNVKFAYKRGDFHVIDAWEEKPEYEVLKDSEIQGLKVSKGKINGEIGREILYTDETASPEQYQNAIVAKKGGYSSRDAEKARRAGKPAVFSFTQELREGQRINMKQEDDMRDNRDSFSQSSNYEPYSKTESPDQSISENIVASETIPLNPREGEGLYTSPPFGKGYALTDRNAGDEQIPENALVDSYRKAFEFSEDQLVLDSRNLSNGVKQVIEYLDAEFKILIVERPDTEVLKAAVSDDFDLFVAEERHIDYLRSELAKAEKRFMLDKLRNLDSN